MSDTPRTDAEFDDAEKYPHRECIEFAKTLEREVATLQAEKGDAITWVMYKQRAEAAEHELAEARTEIVYLRDALDEQYRARGWQTLPRSRSEPHARSGGFVPVTTADPADVDSLQPGGGEALADWKAANPLPREDSEEKR